MTVTTLSSNKQLNWRYRPVLWGVIALIAVFFVWAQQSEIDQHVRGEGRIVPAGKARIIQHLEGGIIEDILVKEGQNIRKGEKLFLVANTQAKAKLKELSVALQSLQLTQARLQAERDGSKKLALPAELEENYPDLSRSERRLFKANNSEFFEKVNGLKERLKQKKLRESELQTKLDNLQKELDISKKQMGIKEKLFNQGVVSESVLLGVQGDVQRLVTQLGQVEKEIPIIHAERAEINSLIEEVRQNRRALIGEELNKIKVHQKKLDEQIKALQDEVQRTAIISPVNGVVNKLHINTIGGVSQPGAPLLEIIPVDETLIVEGKISTDDRGKIWLGLPVIAKISAYDYTLYGGIEGELTYISADTLREKDSEFYQVKVTLTSDRLKQDKPVYPGMTAEINILTGKISILHALLKPFWNIQGNALQEM